MPPWSSLGGVSEQSVDKHGGDLDLDCFSPCSLWADDVSGKRLPQWWGCLRVSRRRDVQLTSGCLWPSQQCGGCRKNESVPLILRFWLPFVPPFDVRVYLWRGGVFIYSLQTCVTVYWRPGEEIGEREWTPTKLLRPSGPSLISFAQSFLVFMQYLGAIEEEEDQDQDHNKRTCQNLPILKHGTLLSLLLENRHHTILYHKAWQITSNTVMKVVSRRLLKERGTSELIYHGGNQLGGDL